MVDEPWVFTQSEGELLLHTDVAGRAARLGHRLTIRMATWQATVSWDGDEPTAVAARVDVGSLEVVSGAGGVTPLSGPEKAVARGNALGALHADDYPLITFQCREPVRTRIGYDLPGTLEIHGATRSHVIPLAVVEETDQWLLSFECPVRQSDFGVKPFSLMMGSLKVADEVTVAWTATWARP